MPESEQARKRLAQLMNERRVDLGLRWTEVGEAGDISPETLRVVRRTTAPLRDLTKAGIERGLRWEHGSVDAVLDGDDPVPLPDDDLTPAEREQVDSFIAALIEARRRRERHSA